MKSLNTTLGNGPTCTYFPEQSRIPAANSQNNQFHPRNSSRFLGHMYLCAHIFGSCSFHVFKQLTDNDHSFYFVLRCLLNSHMGLLPAVKILQAENTENKRIALHGCTTDGEKQTQISV